MVFMENWSGNQRECSGSKEDCRGLDCGSQVHWMDIAMRRSLGWFSVKHWLIAEIKVQGLRFYEFFRLFEGADGL